MVLRELPKMEGVTIRLPTELREKIDNFAEVHGITRSEALKRATELFLSSTNCIHCGALNLQGSTECVECHKKLYSEEEILHVMSKLAARKAAEHNYPYGEDNGYIHTYIPRIIMFRLGHGVKYKLEYQITLPSGTLLHLDMQSKFIDVDKDEIIAELEKEVTA